jgi:hypothetical protein
MPTHAYHRESAQHRVPSLEVSIKPRFAGQEIQPTDDVVAVDGLGVVPRGPILILAIHIALPHGEAHHSEVCRSSVSTRRPTSASENAIRIESPATRRSHARASQR